MVAENLKLNKKQYLTVEINMVIYVDSREQKPLWKVDEKTIISKKLDEGDYTTEELLNKSHIERKSGNDLYSCLVSRKQHPRFRNEILRAIEKKIKLAIFVECPKEDFIAKKFKFGYKLKAPPGTLRKIIATMEDKYNLTFVFCKNREDMRKKSLSWFVNERRKYGEILSINCYDKFRN